MDRASPYYRQVQLLSRVLPLVAAEKCFALKGGTAINLFVRDLPRLSVDIDLVYLPMEDRATSLANIHKALTRISDAIEKALRPVNVLKAFKTQDDSLKLIVQQGDAQIKIELSPVLRGTVHPEILMEPVQKVQDEFGYAEIQVVAFPDLYAGKICAALDRQHPRDLFDIKLLMENEGLSDDLRKTFLVYLISHGRPIAELLRPRPKDIRGLYEGEFKQMAEIDVPFEELETVRATLIRQINQDLTDNERRFLMTFKNREPVWELLGIPGVEALPAVRWKMINLGKMTDAKHKAAVEALDRALFAEK